MRHISLGKSLIVQYPIGSDINSAMNYIKIVVRKLKPLITGKSVTFWVRGSSGAMLAGMISSKIEGISINYVRKEKEYGHNSSVHTNADINIILDDFCRSGNTLNAIKKFMDKHGVYRVDILILANLYDGETELPFSFTPRILLCDDGCKSLKLLQ